MAWTNAFDAGACLVQIYDSSSFYGDGSPLWEGSLAKGESHTADNSWDPGETITVSVDSNGIVTLTGSANNTTIGSGRTYGASVIPQVGYTAARLADVYGNADQWLVFVSAVAAPDSSTNTEDTFEFTFGSPCTPNPFVLEYDIAPARFGVESSNDILSGTDESSPDFLYLAFNPEIDTSNTSFWTEFVGCAIDTSLLLEKALQTVFIPGQPALDYRPYSKTCPVPPPVTPPKRWVTKTVCGTKEVYSFKAYLDSELGVIKTATETRYVLPGVPTTSSITGLPYTGYTVVPGSLTLLSTTPYCATVTVYE